MEKISWKFYRNKPHFEEILGRSLSNKGDFRAIFWPLLQGV